MNQIKNLNELQITDNLIKEARAEISRIETILSDNDAVNVLKSRISDINGKLSENRKNRTDLELETEDLRKHISQINSKLYGGKVNNPKELMDLEKDVNALKSRLQEKEDDLLLLMDSEENINKQIVDTTQELNKVETDQKSDREKFLLQKSELEQQIEILLAQRNDYVNEIDDNILSVYERINSKKGNAVVKVEQGRCQGCRIALSVNELQRARAGSLVQCSSCGMILFME